MFLYFKDEYKTNIILPKSISSNRCLSDGTQNSSKPIALRIWLTQLYPNTQKSNIVFKKFLIMLSKEDPFPKLSGHVLFQ
jgi:hypothetical protein